MQTRNHTDPLDFSSVRRSYKKKLTPSGRKTLKEQTTFESTSGLIDSPASRGSAYRRVQTLGSNTTLPVLSPNTVSVTRPSSTSVTYTHSSTAKEVASNLNLISAEEARQLWRIRSSFTRSELNFIGCAESFGINEARHLASKFGWQYQLPLRELHAMRNEPGRSYTKQSAKHKRLSSEKVSSRKHSLAV